MNALLIGGAGYLGTSLYVRAYLSKLYKKITIVDSLIFSQGYLIPDILIDPNANFINCDVEEIPQSVIDEADVIYLLAAYVGGPLCDKYPDEAQRINVEYPEKLVSQLKNQQLIYTCSSSGYGEANKLCDETVPMNSINLYGKTKEEGENAVMAYKNTTSFRLATVWGRGLRHRFDLLINDLTWQAVKFGELELYQGDYKRCYINIGDVGDLLFNAGGNKTIQGEIFNAAGENFTKTELIDKIKRYVPDLEVRFSDEEDKDKRCYFLDCTKIKSMGFKFNRTLNNSLKSLIEYYDILEPQDYFNPAMRNI